MRVRDRVRVRDRISDRVWRRIRVCVTGITNLPPGQPLPCIAQDPRSKLMVWLGFKLRFRLKLRLRLRLRFRLRLRLNPDTNRQRPLQLRLGSICLWHKQNPASNPDPVPSPSVD